MPRATRSYLPRYHREIVLSLLPTIPSLFLVLSSSSSSFSSVSLGKIVCCVRGHLFLSSRAYRSLTRAPPIAPSLLLRFLPVSASSTAFRHFLFFSSLGSIGFRRSRSKIGLFTSCASRRTLEGIGDRFRERKGSRERGKKNSPSFGPRGSRDRKPHGTVGA